MGRRMRLIIIIVTKSRIRYRHCREKRPKPAHRAGRKSGPDQGNFFQIAPLRSQ